MDTAKQEPYIIVYRFMSRELGLSGNALLAYARVFSFCIRGGEYFESRERTAEMLGISPRTVIRLFDELVESNLIVCVGEKILPSGRATKCYQLVDEAIPERIFKQNSRGYTTDELSYERNLTHDSMSVEPQDSSDKLSPLEFTSPDRLSWPSLPDCHPIIKKENKAFKR